MTQKGLIYENITCIMFGEVGKIDHIRTVLYIHLHHVTH